MLNWLKGFFGTLTSFHVSTLGGVLLAAGHFLPQYGIAIAAAPYLVGVGTLLLGGGAVNGNPLPSVPAEDPVGAASDALIAGVLQTALAQHQANNAPPAAK